jgi:hypothetical protein
VVPGRQAERYYTDLRKFLDATVFCIPDRGEVARSA